MSTALVTGSTERVRSAAATLRSEGFETVALNGWDSRGGRHIVVTDEAGALAGSLAQAAARVPRGSLDCYLQLPTWASSPNVSVPSLVARVEAVATVAPLLAYGATVLLVADEPGWNRQRRDGLRLLAEAAVADYGDQSVKVSVFGEPRFPTDMVAPTPGRRPGAPPLPSLADVSPDLDYADWRSDILSLTSGSGPTYLYFGWVGKDSRPQTAILRGAVLSPLPPVGVGSGSSFSWGHSDPSTHVLARALLADAAGAHGRCPACQEQPDCPMCGGSGLSPWARGLVDAFVEEVIRFLPPEGFELPASDVAAWVRRRGMAPAASEGRAGAPAEAWCAVMAGSPG